MKNVISIWGGRGDFIMTKVISHPNGPLQKTNHQNMHSQLINMNLQKGMVINGYIVHTLTHPKTFTHDCVSVFDKYLHWPHVSVSVSVKKIIHKNNISVM